MKYQERKERKMPSKSAIKSHWCEWLIENGKFECWDEVWEDDYCFACGMKWNIGNGGATERAHIQPRCYGGEDDPANIHLLCRICHKDSEVFFGAMPPDAARAYYFAWLKHRSAKDVLMRWYAPVPDGLEGAIIAGHPKL